MDDLAKEFAKAVKANKEFLKEKDRQEARETISNVTVENFATLKEWTLMFFEQNLILQDFYEQLMREKLIGTYPPVEE